MIPQDSPDFAEIVQSSRKACEALSSEDDGLKREILTHAGNRWSLGVVYALGAADKPLRHSEISRTLDGVTQRMLTRTLRHLERDGLIARQDYQEIPPRVEYRLTSLGGGLLAGMIPLWQWVIENGDAFRGARLHFDNRQRSAPDSE